VIRRQIRHFQRAVWSGLQVVRPAAIERMQSLR
jgi:hypothetical protein